MRTIAEDFDEIFAERERAARPRSIAEDFDEIFAEREEAARSRSIAEDFDEIFAEREKTSDLSAPARSEHGNNAPIDLSGMEQDPTNLGRAAGNAYTQYRKQQGEMDLKDAGVLSYDIGKAQTAPLHEISKIRGMTPAEQQIALLARVAESEGDPEEAKRLWDALRGRQQVLESSGDKLVREGESRYSAYEQPDNEFWKWLLNTVESSGMTVASGLRSGAAWALGPVAGGIMSLLNTVTEASTEAGGAYAEGKRRGMPPEQLLDVAEKTQDRNVALLLASNLLGDWATFGMDKGLGKLAQKITGNGILSRLGRFATKEVVPYVAEGATEYPEGFGQEVITQNALGDPMDLRKAHEAGMMEGTGALLYTAVGRGTRGMIDMARRGSSGGKNVDDAGEIPSPIQTPPKKDISQATNFEEILDALADESFSVEDIPDDASDNQGGGPVVLKGDSIPTTVIGGDTTPKAGEPVVNVSPVMSGTPIKVDGTVVDDGSAAPVAPVGQKQTRSPGGILASLMSGKTDAAPVVVAPEQAIPVVATQPQQGNEDVAEIVKNAADVMAKAQGNEAAPVVRPEAPVVEPASDVPTPGKDSIVRYRENGDLKETPVRYEIVEADRLKTSRSNGYPKELQPRDTDKAISDYRVGTMAADLKAELLGFDDFPDRGAPTTVQDDVVAAGNHRTWAVDRAYDAKTEGAKRYREYLAGPVAKELGDDPERIMGMKKPVLVRKLQDGSVNLRALAEDANASVVGDMGASEQAKMDADKISDAMLGTFDVDDAGTITRDFVESFAKNIVRETEMGRFLDKDGQLSQDGIRRIRNALVTRAYGDPALVGRIAESTDDNAKRISNGLMAAAPVIARMEGRIEKGLLHPLSIKKDLMAAVTLVHTARSEGRNIEEYLTDQTSLFDQKGHSEETKALARFLYGNKASTKAVREFLTRYAQNIERLGAPNEQALPGAEAVVPTKRDLVSRLLGVQMEGQRESAGLFDGVDEKPVKRPDKQTVAKIREEIRNKTKAQIRAEHGDEIAAKNGLDATANAIAEKKANDLVAPLAEEPKRNQTQEPQSVPESPGAGGEGFDSPEATRQEPTRTRPKTGAENSNGNIALPEGHGKTAGREAAETGGGEEKISRRAGQTGQEMPTGQPIGRLDQSLLTEKGSVKPGREPSDNYRLATNRDAEYMQAVERGDLGTAQRMADEAAKTAGYGITAMHGTPQAGFTAFDIDRSGESIDSGWLGKGAYFTTSEASARHYAKADAFAGEKKGPWSVDSNGAGIGRFYIGGKLFDWGKKTQGVRGLVSRGERLPESIHDKVIEQTGFRFNPRAESEEMARDERRISEAVTDVLRSQGYDGVTATFDSNGNREIVVFSPEQVKSAEPIVRDDNGNVIPLPKRFNARKDDIRYSLAKGGNASKTDADYIQAVETGDMETAQRMVDKAASAAGYTERLYHGTPNGTFNVFRGWQHFTPNEKYAGVYKKQGASSNEYKNTATTPRTYGVFAKIEKPFDTRNSVESEIFRNEFFQKRGNGAPLSERGLPDWTDGNDLVEFFEENGYDYDAILLDEGGTGGYGDEVRDRGISYVIKESAQVKSADPVTYDDNGDVIPLSQRFNAGSEDIRYSAGMRDSEHPVTLEGLRRSVPGAKISDLGNGKYRLDLHNGESIIVSTVKEIPMDPDVVRRDYGREPAAGEVVAGASRTIDGRRFIELAEGIAGEGTLDHEIFETARDMVLTAEEKDILDREIGSTEAQAEAYREFQANRKGAMTGRIVRVFQKLKDFFGAIRARLFGKKSLDVFREIAQGKVWGREARGTGAGAYSLGAEAEAGLNEDSAKFGRAVDAFVAGKLNPRQPIPVMTTPLALHLAGADVVPMDIPHNVLKKVFEEHSLSPQVVKQIPKAMADPVMVFRSETTPGSLVVLLDLRDEKRGSVVVPLALNASAPGRGGYRVNLITSAYYRTKESGKPQDNWVTDQIEKGNLRYIDKRKSSRWATLSGQTLSDGTSLSTWMDMGNFLKRNIHTEEDLVKAREQSRTRYSLAQKPSGTPQKWEPVAKGLERVVAPQQRKLSFIERLQAARHWWQTEMMDDISPIRDYFGADIYVKTTNAIHGINSRAQALIEFGDKAKGVKSLFDIFGAIPQNEHEGLMHYAVYKHLLDIAGSSEGAQRLAAPLARLAKEAMDKAKELETTLPKDEFHHRDLLDGAKAYRELARDYEEQVKGLTQQIKVTKAKETQYRAAISRMDQLYPSWAGAQRDLVKYSQHLLGKLRAAGVVSDELYSLLTQKYPNYIPLQRDFGTEEGVASFVKTRGLVNLASPLKRLKGSKRDVLDPLLQIISNTYVVESLVGKQNAARDIAEMADKAELLGLVEPTTDRHHGPDEYVFHVWENGKRKFYTTTPDIYAALVMSSGSPKDSVLTKILSAPVKVLRAGVTHGVGFILRNPIRDTINAGVVGEHFTPVVDSLKGMFHVWKQDAVFEEFMKSGAMQGLAYMSEKSRKDMAAKIRQGRGKTRFLNKMKHPISTLWDALGDAAQLTELGTRVGQYQKMRERGESMERSAFVSRDLINYLRGGRTSKMITKFNPFFNAQLQGVAKGLRSFYHDGKIDAGTIARAMLYITLPSMLTCFWNLGGDDDRRKKYLSIPAWQRNLFWNIVVGKGNDAWVIKIPKPFDLGVVFGSIPERFVDYLYAEDKRAFKGIGTSLFNALSPEVAPLFMGLPFELNANYSMFYERGIVPQSQMQLTPKLQYGAYTAEWAKWAGEKFNLSPRKLEYAVLQLSGNLGKETSNLADTAFRAVTGETRPAREWYQQTPGVSAFAVPAKSMKRWEQTFQDEREEIDTLFRSAKQIYQNSGRGALTLQERRILGAENGVRQVNQLFTNKGGIDDLRREISRITVAKGISAEEKRARVDRLEAKIGNLSERGLAYIDRIKKSMNRGE